MPLITAAILAYAAGLLTGFGGAFVWTTIGAAIAIVQGSRRPRERLALAALAAAGFAIASTASAATDTCLAHLAARHSWELTLDADAAPGAFVPARHACGVKVRLALESGRAEAGARVVARGDAARARDALIVTRATLGVIAPPGLLARWRAAIGRRIDLHFRADAPLVRALLIADMRELAPDVRNRFAAAGLSHMLSVSGLHVGLVAMAGLLIAQILGVARRRAEAAVCAITALYVAIIGAPLPAVRAAMMLGAYSLSRAVQRPTSPWAILAVGVALPLLDPTAVLDVGFQLSVVGMVALVAAGALAKRWSWLGVAGWRGTLRRSLVVSIAATLLTAPIVAATFGRVSVVGVASNLVAVPIMAALQPMLFLAALLFPLPFAAQFVADAAHPLIAMVDAIASAAARLPGASIVVVTDPTTMLLAGAAATAFVVAAVSRFPGRALVAGAAALTLIAWRPLLPVRAGRTELHMIDVGQGDAIALRTTRGRWVLFDAGRDWMGGDEGQRDVIPYIAARGGDVAAFVLSHPHADHVGGAASTFRALTPAWYFDPGYAGGTASYSSSLAEARRQRMHWQRVHPGDSIVVDEATVTFLAPDSAWVDEQRDPNLASTVARVRVGNVSFLLTGDAEAPEEQWLLAHARDDLRADVLKVAHHGSSTSSTRAFLDAVEPRLALVSVGAANTYGHPSASVMQALAAHGAIALRTDLHGSIVIRTDGRRIEVELGDERWAIR